MDNFLSTVISQLKLARECALLGEYNESLVYYDGIITKMKQVINGISDSVKREKWIHHREMLLDEYKNVRDISVHLSSFFVNEHKDNKDQDVNMDVEPPQDRQKAIYEPNWIKNDNKPKFVQKKPNLPVKKGGGSAVNKVKVVSAAPKSFGVNKREDNRKPPIPISNVGRKPSSGKITKPANPIGQKRPLGHVDAGKISYANVDAKPAKGNANPKDKNAPKETEKENPQTNEEQTDQTSEEPAEPKFIPSVVDKDLAETIERDILDKKPNVHWEDVAGLDEAKQLLKEAILLPRIRPDFFQGIMRPWKGILMFGPPGTGKTMLAKAVATECETTFFSVSTTTIASKWRGDSERMVRLIFEMARFYAPSTIFIDEIDSICSSRGTEGEHESAKKVKSEILTQLDGVTSVSDPEKSVTLLGATNFPWDLDEALIRRLEKRIYIPLPDQDDRVKMFTILMNSSKYKVGEDVDFHKLAEKMDGYSCSDIATVVRDALMTPMREMMQRLSLDEMKHSKEEVRLSTSNDFESALAKVNSSITHERIKKYEDWFKTYGST